MWQYNITGTMTVQLGSFVIVIGMTDKSGFRIKTTDIFEQTAIGVTVGHHTDDELRFAGINFLQELFIGSVTVGMTDALAFQMLNNLRVIINHQVPLFHLAEDPEKLVSTLVITEQNNRVERMLLFALFDVLALKYREIFFEFSV